jgi:hypothetical protein
MASINSTFSASSKSCPFSFKIWLKPIKALKGDLKSCEIIENSLF